MAGELDPLDPEIAKFFETGELTGELAAEQAAPVDDTLQQLQQQQITQPAPVQQPVQQQVQQPYEDPNLVTLRSQLGQLQNYSASLERAIQQLQQAGVQQTQQQQQAAIPDPDTDPLGYTMYELAEVKKMMAQMMNHTQVQHETQTQLNQLSNFVHDARQQSEAFAKTVPDFGQAYSYIRNIRVSDLRDMGLNEAQIKEALVKEELTIASQAMRNGQNPAQFIYNIAKRYGYQPAAQPQPAADRLAALQKGVSTTSQHVQAAAAATNLSMDAVKSMASDQLDKLVEADDLWHKVVGGKPSGDSIFH
ncbi:MAG: hypothetical protein [Podoviridae sp. ctQNx1]|nr:MAG: hypothetical protein [Podoviridae sp. ctQNx1]UOF78146.1 hypothetical protein [Caudoviricetes sp.]